MGRLQLLLTHGLQLILEQEELLLQQDVFPFHHGDMNRLQWLMVPEIHDIVIFIRSGAVLLL
jgi:hypothetical protein